MKIQRFGILAGVLVLAACSSNTVKDTLGLERKAPDEFRVVSRPPLYIPPQFNLEPPMAGAASPTVVPADKKAQELVLGGGKIEGGAEVFSLKQGGADTAVQSVETSNLVKSSSAVSSGEQQFLKNIGAEKADPKVRENLVQQEIVKQEKQEESSWWDFFSTAREKKEPVVNSKAEAERIRENKDTGKPVTEGATPDTAGKDRGWFRDWLGW